MGLGRAAASLATRPDLWPTATVVAMRLARPRWWRRSPRLPVPDDAYWRFRMTTAYGGAGDEVPHAHDVVEYLEWCRAAAPRRCRARVPVHQRDGGRL